MAYTAEISRTNPSCFLFLIDQSGSMIEPFAVQPGKNKAAEVATAINRLLQTLASALCQGARGSRPLSRRRHRLRRQQRQFGPGRKVGRPNACAHQPAGRPSAARRAARQEIDDGTGGLIEQKVKFPIWLDPLANGQTPMCKALDLAWNSLNDFVGAYPECFPPIVINITDGKATDGDPESHARCLRDLSSHDGNVLLFNVHLSSRRDSPIELPFTEADLPDDFARCFTASRASCHPASAKRPSARVTSSTIRRGASCSTPTWCR